MTDRFIRLPAMLVSVLVVLAIFVNLHVPFLPSGDSPIHSEEVLIVTAGMFWLALRVGTARTMLSLREAAIFGLLILGPPVFAGVESGISSHDLVNGALAAATRLYRLLPQYAVAFVLGFVPAFTRSAER